MKIKDLIPNEEQILKFQNIESTLLNRRAKGRIAGWGAVLSALIQVLILIINKKDLIEFNSISELISSSLFLPTVFM